MFDYIYDFKYNPTISVLKEIILLLPKNGLNINSPYNNIHGLSLLHIRQPYETMKYLLDIGGDPNLNSLYYELKPIHFQYDYRTIKLLIDRGAQPNPVDVNYFNPLFWQKDLESMKYLLRYNDIYNCNRFPKPDHYQNNHPYMIMLIEGGYEPYSELNISITPLFLQNDIDTIDYIMDYCFDHHIPNYDLVLESLLFKPKLKPNMITLFTKYTKRFNKYINNYDINFQNGYNINHQNIIGNTPLHVQYIPENIMSLLENNSDCKIKNDNGLTPYDFHFKRKNLYIANIIKQYSSVKIIQNCWRKFWFNKTYIKPKFYKNKIKFLEDFKLLPPSQCGLFPGGIDYQNAFNDFNNCLIY